MGAEQGPMTPELAAAFCNRDAAIFLSILAESPLLGLTQTELRSRFAGVINKEGRGYPQDRDTAWFALHDAWPLLRAADLVDDLGKPLGDALWDPLYEARADRRRGRVTKLGAALVSAAAVAGQVPDPAVGVKAVSTPYGWGKTAARTLTAIRIRWVLQTLGAHDSFFNELARGSGPDPSHWSPLRRWLPDRDPLVKDGLVVVRSTWEPPMSTVEPTPAIAAVLTVLGATFEPPTARGGAVESPSVG